MNKIAILEERKRLLLLKLRRMDIHLDSLFTLCYSLKERDLEWKLAVFSEKKIFPRETLEVTEIAKKENGEE